MVHFIHLDRIVVLALMMGIAVGPARSASAAPDGSALCPKPPTSSRLLRCGAKLGTKKNYRGSGEAYSMAFDALSSKRQSGNAGADIAFLAYDAYWSAFEAEGDVAMLRAAHEILMHWRRLAGPGSRAKRLLEVERTAAELSAILGPLERMNEAFDEGDLGRTSESYEQLVTILKQQERPGLMIARLTLDVSRSYYEHESEDRDEVIALLQEARGWLIAMQDLGPFGDGSSEGVDIEIERLLRYIEIRIRELQRPPEVVEVPVPTPGPSKPQPQLERPIALASVGFTTAAFGVLLIAGNTLFEARARQRIGQLDYQPGDEAYSLIAEYQAYSQTRNTGGMVLGGALLFAGVAVASIGLAGLRGKRRLANMSARLAPSVSRSRVGLSLFRRF